MILMLVLMLVLILVLVLELILVLVLTAERELERAPVLELVPSPGGEEGNARWSMRLAHRLALAAASPVAAVSINGANYYYIVAFPSTFSTVWPPVGSGSSGCSDHEQRWRGNATAGG